MSPAEIDDINVLQARLGAMARAVHALPVRPNLLFVDGHLRLPDVSPRVLQRPVIAGDASVSLIAMAGIVAKVVRDDIMQRLHLEYPQYGFDRHAGYATKRHLEVLNNMGPCPIHRRSYRPVREAERLHGINKLTTPDMHSN